MIPPWTLRDYSTRLYPFADLVRLQINEPHLTALTLDSPRWKEREDQKSSWHRNFYGTFHSWAGVYREFVERVVATWMSRSFYFQAVPTFRVHLPGNVAVGSWHTDATYHHPLEETTFWVPLTRACDTSSVWIADDHGSRYAPCVEPGQVVEFSAAKRVHGNVLNTSGLSRVSFDFRCLPVDELPEVEGPPSENTKLRFVPGEYYATDIVNPRGK